MQHRKSSSPNPFAPKINKCSPLYELANYFILSRILYYVPYNSPIHPGRVFTTFAAISSIVEALNGNGASYTVNQSLPDSKRAIGRALLKSALCIQLGVLGSFVLLAAYFHRKCKKSGLLPSNLRAVLITLYCSSALIASRTIYRTIEYFTTANVRYTAGLDPSTLSPLIRYEWFFYVFEASLMLANTFLLNARHPMRFLPRDNRIYLAEDGTTEIQGPGYEDKRPFIVTVFDPFDLVGMCQGRNMQKKFWETHEEGRLETTDVAKSEKDKATRIEGVFV
jgi:hypothetical protein